MQAPITGRITGKLASAFAAAVLLTSSGLAAAQDIPLFNTEPDEWYTLGGDYAHTRFTPADEITAENFSDLEVAWEWDGASFNAISGRSTPSLIDGKLITVAGNKRYVIAIDPKTGDTIWTYREPDTGRAAYSMRADYGKGVGYGEVDGRGVIYIVSPAFFLTALDAETGVPLEGFGRPVPIDGFPETGVVDLIADLGHPYDPYDGIPLETGYITSSSPPIVVNDTVIVGNSAEQGYHQARIENVPGDILAYDARTGALKWKFNVIPKPGEYGHETWENDAWEWTGDVSSWAPLTADPVNNLVYIPTNSATIDYYGGFRPGDNLYGAALIALDVETGERAWHFQMVKHEIWNFDNPTAPVLLDLNMPGRGTVPAVMQITKQAWVYAFNRVTGEPLWPIVDRPVPPSIVPGEVLSPTQPHVTKPAAYDMQGITEDDLIDFTPALRAEALEVMDDYVMGPLFNPPIHADNAMGKYAAMNCPGGAGGSNITAPAVADPTTGMLYVSSHKACFTLRLIPGEESDLLFPNSTGTTTARYANGARGATARTPRLASGIPIWKPPYSRITAIDMNTGEHAWMIPTGETPDRIKNSPALDGVDIGNTGTGALVPMVVTANMLIYSDQASDGTPMLYAIDKASGDIVGEIEAPARSSYGMSSWVLDGHQYIMLQTGSKLTAMALPGARDEGGDAH
ncbi:MAG: PQQ-binding-like beta-propeller repeat protein [Gammaproteobacteria bacterium]|jgi:quinoprotein glucose dehydrogenase|nr:PQQ-binding-like beta-propeller repeat protein [Gammaproteobacteria bacterium]MBT3859094.1 PQQ-binding-like beta-propeller repeat protein [Gammaproteobacteria bacterium]MBT3987094.1 PQQ-binding-like beta-propeller repeat protein [Gammaproteobacteria bacterium]MBT4256133.1 PQQ-binding-like beta-propeller repeat protein [Gammaproteobacteria bacterium]MBT4580641.1 PQQ-binding-like beta-propeller repeat protein [Gammaproteobacteria bacterium]